MGFFEKLKKAIKKIKAKLITFFVIFLVICVWGVAPLTRAYVSAVHKIIEYDNRLAAIEEVSQEEAERLRQQLAKIQEQCKSVISWFNFLEKKS